MQRMNLKKVCNYSLHSRNNFFWGADFWSIKVVEKGESLPDIEEVKVAPQNLLKKRPYSRSIRKPSHKKRHKFTSRKDPVESEDPKTSKENHQATREYSSTNLDNFNSAPADFIDHSQTNQLASHEDNQAPAEDKNTTSQNPSIDPIPDQPPSPNPIQEPENFLDVPSEIQTPDLSNSHHTSDIPNTQNQQSTNHQNKPPTTISNEEQPNHPNSQPSQNNPQGDNLGDTPNLNNQNPSQINAAHQSATASEPAKENINKSKPKCENKTFSRMNSLGSRSDMTI